MDSVHDFVTQIVWKLLMLFVHTVHSTEHVSRNRLDSRELQDVLET